MSFHETIATDEADRFERYATEIGDIQRRRAEASGTISRALHVKQHVGAIPEHRPLGAMIRARAIGYRSSALGRKAAKEPNSLVSL